MVNNERESYIYALRRPGWSLSPNGDLGGGLWDEVTKKH